MEFCREYDSMLLFIGCPARSGFWNMFPVAQAMWQVRRTLEEYSWWSDAVDRRQQRHTLQCVQPRLRTCRSPTVTLWAHVYICETTTNQKMSNWFPFATYTSSYNNQIPSNSAITAITFLSILVVRPLENFFILYLSVFNKRITWKIKERERGRESGSCG